MKKLLQLTLLISCIMCLTIRGQAQPSGFVDQVYASGFNTLIGLTFDSLGRMYAWERGGSVYVLENQLSTSNPILSLDDEVGGWRDFGLLSVALDPDFLTNGHMYLLYTVDYNHFDLGHPGKDSTFAAYGRIVRYTVTNPTAAIDVMTINPATRTVLLGATPQTGFPCVHQSHHVGYIQFGRDGTLLATCGDAASYSETDKGGYLYNGWVNEALAAGILTNAENIGAYRSQASFSLDGKMVRIDPNTGNGIPSNPYYDALNPGSIESRTWARGLRNPCRMAYMPGTGSSNPADGDPGVFFIGDVGWNRQEEMMICDTAAMNFGWPFFEGFDARSDYTDANFSAYQPGVGTPPHDPPVYDWRNGKTARVMHNGTIYNMGAGGNPVNGPSFDGNCSMGGVWYTGTDFPAQYQNSYYHADYGRGWIYQFTFDNNLEPVSVTSFIPNGGGGAVTGLGTNPVTGGLYYVNRSAVIREIAYVGENLPPTAIIAADQTTGSDGLIVNFRGNRSTDPELDALTHSWDFGDGTTSNMVNPSHTFTSGTNTPKKFTVKLTVDDGNGFPNTDSVVISLNNTPPVILSTSIDGKNYYSGIENLTLTCLATDAEDNANQLSYEWQTFLYHDNHNHPEPVAVSQNASTILSPIGCDGILYFYRVRLKVTDTGGLSAVYEKDIYPDCGGSGSNPLARFSYIATSTSPTNIKFDAISSYDLDGPIVSYDWDFGDGQTGTGVNPSHVYFEDGSYTVTLTVKDTDGNTNMTGSVITVVCGTSPAGSADGILEYERWNGVSGTSLSAIDFDTDVPTQITTVTETEVPTNVADNYGGRIRGYLYPPQTGTYKMWIASDDNGSLLVSSNDNPANVTQVAYVSSWTSSRQWNKLSGQQGTINLTAGQRYYFEARFKEGGGGDNMAVRWELPDGTIEEPIPAGRIAGYRGGVYPILWRESFYMADGFTDDNGVTPWSLNTTNAGTNAAFEVSGAELTGSNLGGEVVWTSGLIDLSGETSVKVSFNYYGEGDYENDDYVRFYYSLNGGPEQLLLDVTDDPPASPTAFTSGNISGTTLKVIVRMRNSEALEIYHVDDITVTTNGAVGAPTGLNECASCNPNAAPRTALRGQYGSCVSEFNNAWLEIQDEYEEALVSVDDNNQDLGLVTVETFDHGNDPFVFGNYYYMTRSFKISSEKSFASPVDIKLFILPSEFQAIKDASGTVFTLNDLVLEKYTNGVLGEAGTGILSVITPTSVSIGTGPDGAHELVYQVPSFSTLFLRASNTSFPVEWLDFQVEPQGLDALLHWEVAQDGKGSHFEIERSINQRDFQQIGKVLMQAPQNGRNTYTFLDEDIADLGVETIYYRIRQYDFDGVQTLGPLRTLRLDLPSLARIDLYPNPAKAGFTMRYFLPGDVGATYEIYSAVGKQVATGTISNGANDNRVYIQTDSWTSGVYFIRVKHPLGEIKKKIVVE